MSTLVWSVVITCNLILFAVCSAKSTDCVCKTHNMGRMVGSTRSLPINYPWAVSVARFPSKPEIVEQFNNRQLMRRHYCGGTIVSRYWVLTAAHCIISESSVTYYRKPNLLRVAAGNGHDLLLAYKNSSVKVETVHIAPWYDPALPDSYADIALLKVAEPFKFNDLVQPACLWPHVQPEYQPPLVATGWGSLDKLTYNFTCQDWTGRHRTRYMMEAEFVDVSRTSESCGKRSDLICIKSVGNQTASACKGDSGGPLHHIVNGTTYVIGVCSFGPVIQEQDKAETCTSHSVYTNVAIHLEWIKDYVSDLCE